MNIVRDYDQYVNGAWEKTHQMPGDRSRWSTFDMLSHEIQEQLCTLCAADTGLVGQIYAKALKPASKISPKILAMLAEVQKVKTRAGFYTLSWRFYQQGVQTVFGIGRTEDAKNSDVLIPTITQSGLGLPDKNYYTDKAVLLAYRTFIEDLCKLYRCAVNPDAIIAFEGRLAALHKTHAELRNVDTAYNILSAADLPAFFKPFNLDLHRVVVGNVEFLAELPGIIRSTPLPVLKDYLWYKVAASYIEFQPKAVRDVGFKFYGQTLMGRRARHTVENYAVNVVQKFLPVQLEKLYIRHYVDGTVLKRARQMIGKIIAALKEGINTAAWMSAGTKSKSLEKLARIHIGVGYPKKWPETRGLWTGLDVAKTDLTELAMARAKWGFYAHVVAEFYQPVDRALWDMATYEVNACYDLNMNQMLIPAGILQKPFFGFTHPAQNFGGIGCIIGHELTHGFDDQGRKFDPEGNLAAWWTPADIKTYEGRAAKVRDYYSAQRFRGMRVNGKLTQGENLADIGGLTLSLRAMESSGKVSRADYQRFFKTYASLWRQLINKEAAKKSILTNPHAPNPLRVNAVVSHIPEFFEAYGVTVPPAKLKEMREFSIW